MSYHSMLNYFAALHSVFRSDPSRGQPSEFDNAILCLDAEIARFEHWRLQDDEFQKRVHRQWRPDDNLRASEGRKFAASVLERISVVQHMLARGAVGPVGMSGTKNKLYAAWHRASDQKDMMLSLKVIKELNDVLYSISQNYLFQQAQELGRNQQLITHKLQQLLDHQMRPAFATSLNTSSQADEEHERIAEPLFWPHQGGEGRNGVEDEWLPPLEPFYHHALQGLHFIGKLLLDNPEVTQLWERLGVWGLGLFEGPSSLDQIISAYPGISMNGCVLHSVFVDILLHTEHILNRLQETFNDPNVAKFLEELGSLLDSEGPLKDEVLKKSLGSDDVESLAPSEDVDQRLRRIQDLIDDLRNLDAISTLREAYCHRINMTRQSEEVKSGRKEKVSEDHIAPVSGSVKALDGRPTPYLRDILSGTDDLTGDFGSWLGQTKGKQELEKSAAEQV